MSDRRNLLILLIVLLAILALSVVGLTIFELQAAADVVHARQLVAAALWLLVGDALLIVLAAVVLLGDLRQRRGAERRTLEYLARVEQAKAELEQRSAELAQVNRQLDDFACVASHDLKEPLRGIAIYCELLLADYGHKLDDAGRGRLAKMETVCRRLGRLIDDLLTYSQAGKPLADAAEIDLHVVLEDVLATLEPAIERRQAQVRIGSRLPRLRGQATLVGELLRNLIVNALQHNPNPRPVVEIGCSGGAPHTLYVRDNGAGIPPEQQNALLAGLPRPRPRGDSTGWGLSIVRRIVQSHGGKLWFESQPNRGTTVHFTLSSAVVERNSFRTTEQNEFDTTTERNEFRSTRNALQSPGMAGRLESA